MSAKKDPAFLWYCTAWLQSERVRSMTLSQRGAYADLLSFGWLHGSIPADPKKLAGMLGGLTAEVFEEVWSAVGECWSPMPGNPGRLINERQEQERTERKARTEELRSRGQAGGKRSAEQRGGAGPSRHRAGNEAGGEADDEAGDEAEAEAKPKPSTSTTTTSQKDGRMDGGFGSYQDQNGEGVRTRQPGPSLTGEGAIAAALAPSVSKAREAGRG